jgi:hypothetical protein
MRLRGLLGACLSAAVLLASCAKPCSAGRECDPSELCVLPNVNGQGACTPKCAADGGCAGGTSCRIVMDADCPVCANVTRACMTP